MKWLSLSFLCIVLKMYSVQFNSIQQNTYTEWHQTGTSKCNPMSDTLNYLLDWNCQANNQRLTN